MVPPLAPPSRDALRQPRRRRARVGWREAVKRTLVRQYDAALVAGTPQEDYVTSLGMRPNAVFRPVDVVDNAFFARGATRARAEGAIPHPGPYLLSVNRFLPRKNVDLADPRVRSLPHPRPGCRPGAVAAGALGRRPRASWARAAGGRRRRVRRLPASRRAPGVVRRRGALRPPGPVGPLGAGRQRGDGGRLAGAGLNRRWLRAGPSRRQRRHVRPRRSERARRRPRPAYRAGRGPGCAGCEVRREIIAGYTPQAFAEGLWAAVEAASLHADRPMSAGARLVLAALGVVARRHHAFHSVDA